MCDNELLSAMSKTENIDTIKDDIDQAEERAKRIQADETELEKLKTDCTRSDSHSNNI